MNAIKRITFPLGPFAKYEGNPILEPQGETWEAKDVFNPTAIVEDDKIYLLYRAEDRAGIGKWNGTSRIGLAVSSDGIHFERRSEPVLVPTEDYELPGGCEDPRVTQLDGIYYMTYTAYDGEHARLCLAMSEDLVNWEKHGVLFPDWSEGRDRVWSKSGAIVPQKINGKYVMYFGDIDIWIAYSDDGIHWTPQRDPVVRRNNDPAAFDSLLVEPGPAPIVTGEGILLIYNAARMIGTGKDCANDIENAEEQNSDFGYPYYSAGQVLFSLEDPAKVIKRTEKPFFVPSTVDELKGQVDNVVFIEGLVEFKGVWYIYYGMADSKLGVAMYRPK